MPLQLYAVSGSVSSNCCSLSACTDHKPAAWNSVLHCVHCIQVHLYTNTPASNSSHPTYEQLAGSGRDTSKGGRGEVQGQGADGIPPALKSTFYTLRFKPYEASPGPCTPPAAGCTASPSPIYPPYPFLPAPSTATPLTLLHWPFHTSCRLHCTPLPITMAQGAPLGCRISRRCCCDISPLVAGCAAVLKFQLL